MSWALTGGMLIAPAEEVRVVKRGNEGRERENEENIAAAAYPVELMR
jgi:hypothetical protein